MLKLSRILLCILFALPLIACETNVAVSPNPDPTLPPFSSQPEVIDYQHMGKAVYAPVDIPYLVPNPIEIKEIVQSMTSDHMHNYFEISGLADKEVEASINNKVKSLYEQMLAYTNDKIPPYRGLAAAMQEEGELRYSSISLYPTFNYNNVLSVYGFAHINYVDQPTNNYISFTVCETLNFDLNTGETFSIADVFTNDSDALELINSSISQRLSGTTPTDYWHHVPLNLVAPFKGINHNQKFHLNNSMLHVVIDYHNPEFDVGFNYDLVTLPLYSAQGQIAIVDRFYDSNNSIYTKDAIERAFFQYTELKRTVKEELYQKDRVHWNITLNYPEDLTSELVEVINDLRADKGSKAIELSLDAPPRFIEHNIYADIVGPYINISSTASLSNPQWSRWEGAYYVYTRDGTLIKLEDVFAAGFDYRNMIIQALQNRIAEFGFPDIKHSVTVDEISFRLHDSRISFTTKSREWYPGGGIHPLDFELDYKNIGFDNLRIFD